MTHVTMSPTILAAALELSRIHGIAYAAFFLLDRDIAFEVVAELLWNALPSYAECTSDSSTKGIVTIG